jgi:phospholipase/carboxylesterase
MNNHTDLAGPSFLPSNGTTIKNIVIFLHGYGADGDDLIGLSNYFSIKLPNTAFFSPNAPEPTPMGFGRQWLSIDGYDPGSLKQNPGQMLELLETMYEGAVKASIPLNNYINTLLDAYSLKDKDISLVGFSQGTMMAIHAGLRRKNTLGSIIGYSGALIGAKNLKKDIVSDPPPVLLIHGTEDEVVPFESLSHIEKTFDQIKIKYSSHSISGLGHGINEEGMLLGREFILKNL